MGGVLLVLVLVLASVVSDALVAPPRLDRPQRSAAAASEENGVASKKAALFFAIEEFKEFKVADGGVSVDFGVKGGELDRDSRAPSNLAADGAFYAVSPRLGAAADRILQRVADLEAAPSEARDATALFGTAEGAAARLHGAWANLWTTAADATFGANSTRGDATVANIVDATTGIITNVVTFKIDPRREKPGPLAQLRVKIKATPTAPPTTNRLELTFKSVQVRFRKRFLGIFKSIVVPVPATTITRLLFFLRKKIPPRPFFDVLYLDADLRIQRTGEGNVFIQKRLPPALAAP